MQKATNHTFSGWEMVVLCFLAQNAGLGVAMGSLGPLLATTQEHFGITRAAASASMALVNGAIGTMAPLMGGVIHKIKIRFAMIGGAVLCVIGYVILAFTSDFNLAMSAYVLTGVGICLLSILGPAVLISRWFIGDRAKALGIVNLPIFTLLAPYVIGVFLPTLGRFTVLMSIGGIFLLLIPLLSRLIEQPADVGQSPRSTAAASVGNAPAAVEQDLLSTHEILSSAPFWFLSLAIGVIAGTGTTFALHLVPFAVQQGLSLQTASAMLSLYFASGVLGCLVFGWAIDRLGPAVAMTLSTFCQTLAWLAILYVKGLPMFMVTALMGMCVVPMVMMLSASMAALFGAASVGRAIGICFVIKLPFLFIVPPLVGHLFDIKGDYSLAFLVMAGMLAAACLCCVLAVFGTRRRRPDAAH